MSSRPPRRKRRLLNGDDSAVSAQLPQNRRRHDGYESARLVAGGRVGSSWYTYQTSLLPPPPSHARSQQSRVAAVHYSKRGLSTPCPSATKEILDRKCLWIVRPALARNGDSWATPHCGDTRKLSPRLGRRTLKKTEVRTCELLYHPAISLFLVVSPAIALRFTAVSGLRETRSAASSATLRGASGWWWRTCHTPQNLHRIFAEDHRNRVSFAGRL